MFSPDSRFYAAFSLAADLVIVNFCMVIASLPIITAGAATKAGAYVTRQLARDEGSRPFATFWRQFRASFLPSTGYFVGTTCIAVLGIYEIYVIRGAGEGLISPMAALVLESGIWSGLIILTIITVRFYPKCSLKGAVLDAMRDLPRTLLAALGLAALPIVALTTSVGLGTIITYVVLVGLALPWYVAGLILK